jgi:truncated hemoglobin YjbI/ankyrin repeat protein
MEHRRLLGRQEAHRPFVGGEMFARAGGAAAIAALVDGLYDRIETDSALRPFFNRTLINERAAQKRFFTEWLGGESVYTDGAHAPLKHRHDLLPITRQLAKKWLTHFRGALDAAIKDENAREAIYAKVGVLAMAMVNEDDPPSGLRAKPHGMCLRHKPAIEAIGLARKGETAALRKLIARAPEVLSSVPHAATLLQLAVLAGRKPTVQLLLDEGVDPNKPVALFPLIFVTPLCAARAKRRQPIEAMLVAAGAKEDIFTHAFLGQLDALDPELAQVSDPAVDALEITPVHHAVAGEQPDALRLLLANAQSIRGAVRALRDAVQRESVEMVALLLERGAPGSSIGAGRWVLHKELAPMLSRAGARVDRSGSWIGMSCTGNQGRKDDPDFVAALLRYGAQVSDRRFTGQDSDGGFATALHYAAKAGFVKTIALLIDEGADPAAKDGYGRTPLDWLTAAAKSVDRAAVRRLLTL